MRGNFSSTIRRGKAARPAFRTFPRWASEYRPKYRTVTWPLSGIESPADEYAFFLYNVGAKIKADR
jgi:hypothetical protein